MSYAIRQLVVNKQTELMGEILAHLSGPMYRVRYPVEGDEDRDFDIKDEDARTLRPLTWSEAESVLYERYLPGPKEWRVPNDEKKVYHALDSTPVRNRTLVYH